VRTQDEQSEWLVLKLSAQGGLEQMAVSGGNLSAALADRCRNGRFQDLFDHRAAPSVSESIGKALAQGRVWTGNEVLDIARQAVIA